VKTSHFNYFIKNFSQLLPNANTKKLRNLKPAITKQKKPADRKRNRERKQQKPTNNKMK